MLMCGWARHPLPGAKDREHRATCEAGEGYGASNRQQSQHVRYVRYGPDMQCLLYFGQRIMDLPGRQYAPRGKRPEFVHRRFRTEVFHGFAIFSIYAVTPWLFFSLTDVRQCLPFRNPR